MGKMYICSTNNKRKRDMEKPFKLTVIYGKEPCREMTDYDLSIEEVIGKIKDGTLFGDYKVYELDTEDDVKVVAQVLMDADGWDNSYWELEGRKDAVCESNGYFPITRVCRADLEGKGFDTSNVTDDVMKRLASCMENDYLEQMYWLSLEAAADHLDIPRHVLDRNKKPLHKGQKVRWYDPEESARDLNRIYTVYEDPEPEMVRIADECSEAEVYPEELEIVEEETDNQ